MICLARQHIFDGLPIVETLIKVPPDDYRIPNYAGEFIETDITARALISCIVWSVAHDDAVYAFAWNVFLLQISIHADRLITSEDIQKLLPGIPDPKEVHDAYTVDDLVRIYFDCGLFLAED